MLPVALYPAFLMPARPLPLRAGPSGPAGNGLPSLSPELWLLPLIQTLAGLMGPQPAVETKKPPTSQQRTGAPSGYKPIKGKIPTGVVSKAKSLLNQPMGTEVPFELEGRRYLARLEPHYHPPGYQGGPNGWHKGVSVYEAQ